MASRIESVKLERFRAFRALSVDGLGRVNLITGKNNTGKSSLLEGLRIVATDAAIETLRDMLRYREEYASTPDDDSSRQQSPLLFSALFHGFPDLSAKTEPLVLSANGKDYDKSVSVYVNWLSREPDKEGDLRFVEHSPDDPEGSAFLIVSTSDAIRRYKLDDLRDRRLIVRGSSTSSSDCCFVGPYSGMRTTELGKLWDDIALTDDEGVVVDALRIIDPHVSKVTMVGGDGVRERRTAIVRTDQIPHPVPLRSFGDGMNRLFSIVLNLVNSRDKTLLVDEFENGLHHSVQLDAWRIIFRLAHALNIQVFATTHSWDTIETFQKAAGETPDTGVLIRMTRRGEDIVPTVFTEDEVAIATRERIEVR